MPIEKLISYPEVPVVLPEFFEAFCAGEVAGETMFKYGTVTTLRSTIVVRLLQESADPVFIVGEALQSIDDEFDKKVGVRIADGRALARKDFYEDVNWTTFSLSEALETTDDFFGREEKGEVIQVSAVTLPLSELPLPHGIVNRLKMLIEKKK